MMDALFRASLGLLGAALLLCAYWLWLDNPVLVTEYESYIEQPGPYHAGDTLINVLHSCVTRPIVPDSAIRSLENEFVYIFSNKVVGTEPGCYTRKRPFTLPMSAVPGPHLLNRSVRFQINPLKQVVWTAPPLVFEVEK